MKIYKYIVAIVISFIIISLIILFLMSLLTTKIDTFAIDVMNINAGDTTNLLPTLNNNLLIYLKFNNNNLITNSGRHAINATNIDTNTRFSYQNTNIILNNSTTGFNGCTINTTDYVRGNASIQFNGSSGIIQSMNSNFINTNFTVAFYLKNTNNTTGNKTIVAQALQNPTLGWMIRIENSSLKVIIGNNTDNNWTTIITVPNFINSTINNWYHIALTYEQSANPKWNLYLDGTKFTTSSTDNPNEQLQLLSTQVSTSIANTSGSKTIKMRNFGNNMHFLTIGCELITIVRTIVDTSSITTDSTYLDIGLENGIKGVNYDYGYAETGYFYIKFLSGTTTLNLPSRCTNVEILVVGGGGGGGSRHAGGGGAGAVIYLTNQTLEIGSYNIYVGNGGNWINRHGQGGRGENTSVVFNNANLYLAQGGGGGNHAIDTGNSNKDGGSGGGHGGGNGGSQDWINRARGFAVTNNIPSGIYGNNSGLGTWGGRERYWGGGGGGGAGSVGADSIHSNDRSIAGNGGDGIQISITGQPLYYGGGGGGGCAADSTSAGRGGLGGGGDGSKGFENAAIDGTPNTGGGGGGAGFQGGRNGRSGSGGSGVVIFKFRISDFLVNNQILYRNEEPSTFRLGNFLPNQTLMDDFRFYNATLTENQIKTIYYGTLIASINITNNQINDSTDCVPNELAANANLIAIPSSSGLVTNISGITTTTLNTPSTSQFRQTFKLNTYRGNENTSNIELLFSQPLFSTITPNPYSPVKLFNKDSIPSNANNNINYCAFLSTYALNTINDNYVYNYNKDGTYALTSFSVPDCGNIRFNNNARPKGDYIYIKFPESFALLRYAFTAISGFTSRAPAKWTLYIYNQSTSSNISYTYPSSGNPLSVRNYCQTNQRVFMVDMLTNQIISNEYLFVFHNIVGNNRNDNFGMLAFQEMVLYKNNPILT